MAHYGLRDIWREQHPTDRSYTHYAAPSNLHTRLDFILVSESAVGNCTQSAIWDRLLSDHAPCAIGIRLGKPITPIPTWRLDPALLADQLYHSELRKAIEEYFRFNLGSVTSVASVWEAFKVVIRGHCLGLSHSLPRRLTQDLRALESQIADLQARQHAPEEEDRLVRPLRVRYNDIQAQLSRLSIASHTQATHTQADKSGRLLAWLLKKERSSPMVTAVRDAGGTVRRGQSDINSFFFYYFRSLYARAEGPDEDDMIELLNPLDIRALTPEEEKRLEAPLSLVEVTEAIKGLTGGKSPGLDGLPAEFFKQYRSILAPMLLLVYNEAVSCGELPSTMREALITLLLKQGKDPNECDSYRPISLLNVDAKILGSILARRLGTVTPALIHVDQCGFVPGRRTVHNLRRLFYILDEVEDWGGNYAIASLDAGKAFDTVCWEFLILTLRKMGFGNHMLDWIRLLYSKPMARVRTGRLISDRFELGRGTRQGCPLSPQLFAIVIEPMAQFIRERHRAQGISIHGITHNISLYADDVLLYMMEPEKTWPKIQESIKLVGAASGFTINLSKSFILPLGDLQKYQREDLPDLSVRWVKDSFRYLGIQVGYRLESLYDLNYGPALAKLDECIQFWATLPLSPMGRMALIKMVVLPRFLYLFQAIPWFLSRKFFRQLDGSLIGLVWGQGRRKIALETLQRAPGEGGLSLPNMQHYYWAAQLQFVAQWLVSASNPEKELLEAGAIVPLQQTLLTPAQPADASSIIIQVARRVWKQACRTLGIVRPYSPDAALVVYSSLARLDSAFQARNWIAHGCTHLRHIYVGGELLPFETLQQEFHLPNAFYLQYAALRMKCKELWGEGHVEPPTTMVLQELINLGQGSKAVTRLVNVFREEVPRGVLQSRVNWEQDFQMELTEKDWEVACNYVKRVSRNARFQQIQLNLLHRSYLTPLRINKMFPMAASLCPRCASLEADLMHMFWTCPNLSEFWKHVHSLVNRVTEREWPATPMVWLLGLDHTYRRNREAYRFMSLAAILAKREVAKTWKSARGPVYGVWYGELVRWTAAETQALLVAPRPCREEEVVSPMLAWNGLVTRFQYLDDE